MKKIYLSFLVFSLFCSLHVYAVIVPITVTNNTFTPSSINVNVGDVIQWNWSEGNHNTKSNAIPGGAAAWGPASLNSGSTTFSYTVTVAGNYTYFCTIHGVANMSGSFTATALPLELRSFEGKAATRSNWLYWETLTEKDVQSHIIEHSADGKEWTEVGRRPGSSNSTVAIKYELEDQQPFAQTYYRLRSVDVDGKTAFSKVIVLGEPISISKVFPNPTVDQVTVKFVATTTENMHLSMIDISGKLVWDQVVEAQMGLNTTEVSLRQLPPGAYDLILTDERKVSASLRVVKE